MKNAKVTKKNVLGEFESRSSFNYAQQNFLSVLELAVGADYEVKGRVKAFDILSAGKQGIKNKTLAKTYDDYFFDFVICQRSDQAIVCVVELTENRHLKKGYQRQISALETLLNHYCESVALPRLVVAQQRGYALPELIERFEGLLVKDPAILV